MCTNTASVGNTYYRLPLEGIPTYVRTDSGFPVDDKIDRKTRNIARIGTHRRTSRRTEKSQFRHNTPQQHEGSSGKPPKTNRAASRSFF